MCVIDKMLQVVFVIAYRISFFVVIVAACDLVKAIRMQFDVKWFASNEFKCSLRQTQVHIARLIGALSVVTDYYSVSLPATLALRIRTSRR